MNGNFFHLIANLTADPTPVVNQKIAICEFSVAWNDPYRAKDDPKRGNFYDCVAYGKVAEIAQKYLTKGRQVALYGKLKHERWETDGQKRSKHVFTVESLTLIGAQVPEPDRQPTQQNAMDEGGMDEDDGWE